MNNMDGKWQDIQGQNMLNKIQQKRNNYYFFILNFSIYIKITINKLLLYNLLYYVIQI